MERFTEFPLLKHFDGIFLLLYNFIIIILLFQKPQLKKGDPLS